MVKKFQWNILENEMQNIIHKNIISILKNSPKNKIPLNDFIKLLNEKTNHLKIHNNKRYNSTSKYIKYQYNGITKFLDDYNIYGISNICHENKNVLYKKKNINGVIYFSSKVSRINNFLAENKF